MKQKLILVGILGILLLASCGPKRDAEVAKIEAMEESLQMFTAAINNDKADSLITMYVAFANNFPKDSLSAKYLQKAADCAINVGRTDDALEYLDKIIDTYPDFSDLAGCYFLKGYAYEQSGQTDLAVEAYTYFVETYPDHVLAADTRKMIPLLGMSESEMLEYLLSNAGNLNLGE